MYSQGCGGSSPFFGTKSFDSPCNEQLARGIFVSRAAEKLFSEGVILSEAGVPSKRFSCGCWGGEAKDLLFAHAENKADPSIASPNKPTTGLSGTPRKIGATSG